MPRDDSHPLKVRLTVIIEVDPNAYRAEYARPTEARNAIRDDVKASSLDALRQSIYPEGIIVGVREFGS